MYYVESVTGKTAPDKGSTLVLVPLPLFGEWHGKEINMFLRKLRGTEYLYAYYTTSCDIKSRTGFIGHLRCDFGKSGKEFWTTMFPSQWYKKKYPEKFSEKKFP